MLIGSYHRVLPHNILSWKGSQGWPFLQIGPGKFPWYTCFQEVSGSTTVSFSQWKSGSYPTSHRAKGKLMWCVRNSTTFDWRPENLGTCFTCLVCELVKLSLHTVSWRIKLKRGLMVGVGSQAPNFIKFAGD